MGAHDPADRPPRPGADDAFVQGGGEMGALTRAFDWSTTALGPLAGWPQSLRTSVSTMLRSPYPITLFWGPELVMLYNDPFRPIHGEKHPATLGASARVALAEAWEILGPLVARTLATGEPLFVENGAVHFARRPGGLREEAYFTWSYNPTIGEDGTIAGLFAIASETTRQVIGDRRLTTLRELSLRTAYDKRVADVLRSVEDVLGQAGADTPFALLYVADGDRARLVACAGLARGDAAAPVELPLAADAPWPIGRVASTGAEALITDLGAVGPLPGGPHPEPVTRALALPIALGADTSQRGVLVAGLSPLLPLDDDYRSYLELLARQLSAGIASARAYEQEQQRAEKLAELDRAKTDFFSNVSHELRTPLTLILGPVEDALAQPGRALAGDELELVRRNALRLYRMVNTLLDFARIEAGRARATFVATDLAALTAGLASHFRSAADRAGLALELAVPPLPEPVHVDPEMWEQVVLNLLSNALKYTHRGRIRVALEHDADAAVLVVADTGVGIAAADLPRIFDRFYRVGHADGRSHEGTGIGLALVRELIALHGGAIDVASELGAGTTITVRVPRGTAHLPADHVAPAARPPPLAPTAATAAFVEEASRWSTRAASTEAPAADAALPVDRAAPADLAGSRILVVDDNADLRAHVAGLLARAFPDVDTATDGRDALERARRRPPDLIVADVMMPVMDGFALVRALRADPRTRSVPIILLSARAGDESAAAGLDTGADDYLVKPFSARELLARVRGQLEMARVRAAIWRERGRVDELERSLATRDEFIAIAAHELRTPLTALQLQLEGLLALTARTDEATRDRVVRNLTVALRQTGRLTLLVETLLDASRVALGQLDLAPEALDLAELTRAVVAGFTDDAGAVGTRFQLALAPAAGHWDRARVEQLVASLIANAVKYAPGTTVDIAVVADGDAARLVVTDHGLGIEPATLARMFDRFERGVSADRYGGFGVGLYLARQIALAHGGRIDAVSAPDRGTTFTVTLPRAPGLAAAPSPPAASIDTGHALHHPVPS